MERPTSPLMLWLSFYHNLSIGIYVEVEVHACCLMLCVLTLLIGKLQIEVVVRAMQ